jgi:FtsP/CotA-like multicopper oxidase with cupredoxin domain
MTFRVGAVDSTTVLPMTVIAKDGNYIRSATNVDSLRMAPGERWSVLVNFTGLAPGSFVYITNDAMAPFPDGTPADINTVGQIMRFTMTGNPGFVQHSLPAILNPTLAAPYPSLITEPIAQYRNITLKEIQGAGGPLMVTVDGQTYLNPISENPRLGTTEVWRIIDDTGDAHPMHIHGVSFQIVQWQDFDQPTYDTDWLALNGPLPFDHPTLNVNLDNYLIPGTVRTPDALYSQWTDTTQVLPGTVTTIIIRFAPTYGGAFPYDPTDTTTYYVWHCHIVDHEDQDMIRPYHILPALI